MNKKYYIKFFQEISHQDKARNYNFTAGHLGAFSNPFITNQVIENIIKNNTSIFFLLCAFIRILLLIILSIISLKNLAIFIRALLKKMLNRELKLSNDLLVLSIGQGKLENDPYLSKILVLLKSQFDYLKVVGVNPIYVNLKSGFSNNIFDLDNVYNFTQLDIDKFDSFLPNQISFDKKKCIEISNYYLKISNPLDFIDYIKD